MVGDICDEDELNTGHRSEGSFYSIFWWFIKMGTALASFVAGALIVLTLFDQAQVTKVDSIQGSLRELRAEVQSWRDDLALGTGTGLIEKAKKNASDAIDESKEYMTYLEKESVKLKNQVNPTTAAYQRQKQEKLENTLNATRNNVSKLEQLQLRLDGIPPTASDSLAKSIATEVIPLTLQTKLEKARMNSFELMTHLETRSTETRNSREHYDKIMQEIKGVDGRLTNLSETSSLDLIDNELASIENDIVPLTKQTPYTLLMMRIVEIGLPLLLSIFSVFFVLRYSLTEKRSHEIKELIRQRNAERLKEEDNV
jgi:hypothetical protein